MLNDPPERDVWSVTRLNREARMLLETGLRVLWLEGEISNLAQPASGHAYFSLKDSGAQVRCAMFRMRRQLLRFRPANGAQVLVRGRVSLYEPRGDFQFIVDHMEEAGFGALQRAFEELKARLAAEGLFDEALKRPLPTLPRRIGVITSPTGAAIRDIASVLERRFPSVPVVVYPVPVQGDAAPPAVVAALETAAARAECDVLILARGGGSIEDLWAFNDERVARAIRASPIPVVVGVGHEIDFTIADFAADRRAPTPSAAAEMVVPDRVELGQRVARLSHALQRCTNQRVAQAGERVGWLATRLRALHPGRRLQQRAQRLDELDLRLRRGWQRALEQASAAVTGAARALQAVSPLATLARGYAIVADARTGKAVTDTASLALGDSLNARFARGSATVTVNDIKKDEER
ncbi:MAG: exodeoxyribonuclease VII large subunit [Xanthomonadaceae bacterium]|nr:exodeoxyribonuclease VII large subunit [Xanthomonadaceae bacterium]